MGGSGQGREEHEGGRRATRVSWNPDTPGRGPVPALCSPHATRPCLTSPPLQPGKEQPSVGSRGPGRASRRVIKGPRETGGGRGIGVQPIRWPQAASPETAGAANPEADTARAAAPAPRRRGQPRAARRRGAGARGFPASRGASPGRQRSPESSRVGPGPGAPLALLVGAGLRSNGHRRPCGTSVNVCGAL